MFSFVKTVKQPICKAFIEFTFRHIPLNFSLYLLIPMGEYNAVIVLEDRSIEHQYCSVNENFHVNNLLYKTNKSLKMLGFVPQPNLRIFVF